MRPQGNIVVSLPWVYVDGRLAGPIAVLRDIASELIEEIRFVSSEQATTRYGRDHVAGVIEIKTVARKT